ncbi:MAG: MCE family protein [Nocardiopsaceae bacterium]|jgi:virulence factor Mce-like protein|nr:MCE family protein [Nocardiopsaceae bacterium]
MTATWRERAAAGWARLGGRTARRATLVGAVAFVLAVAVAGALMVTLSGPSATRVTAYFPEAVSVYPGSDVRILGVKVGTVDSVRPAGGLVRVIMSVNGTVPVPARADAVVVVPSIVADRYIQLSPAYSGGPRLASGAQIPAGRTATPVELDQLYAAITKFAHDLGPNGVNKHGALSDVINTGAKNLAGNGKAFGTMIYQFSQLQRTLAGSRGNFFATIDNLEMFTRMLKNNNGQVRLAQQQLAQVSSFLAADRQDLSRALNQLATALGQVQGFVQSHRHALKSNLRKLQAVTRILANERSSLAQSLDNYPLAADNLLNAYDPGNGTLDARGDLNEISLGRCSYITNPTQQGCPTGAGGSGAGGTGAGGSGQAAGALPLPVAGAPAPSPGSSAGAGASGGGGR